MVDNEFYNKQSDLSRIKIKLVTDYFITWLNIISSHWNGKIFYIDLFCGPGCYEDGNVSTPLIILENTLKNEKLLDKVKNNLVLWFNDKDKDFIEKLYENINRKFANIQREFKNLNNLFQIYITNHEIPNKEIEDVIKQIDAPMFVFLDPWGYKGISKNLIDITVDKKMSECIFFFNYNRIQGAIFNDTVVETVSEIFGEENLNNLRKRLQAPNLSSYDKEMIILDELVKHFSNNYTRYVVPFCFKKENNQTSHYIIFVTKHPLGQKIMKSLMAKKSDNNIIGGYFTYIPSSPQLSFLTHDTFDSNKDNIKKELCEKYKGMELKFEKLYAQEGYYTPYTVEQYFQVINELDKEGKVKVIYSKTKTGRDRKHSPENLYKYGIIKFEE